MYLFNAMAYTQEAVSGNGYRDYLPRGGMAWSAEHCPMFYSNQMYNRLLWKSPTRSVECNIILPIQAQDNPHPSKHLITQTTRK